MEEQIYDNLAFLSNINKTTNKASEIELIAFARQLKNSPNKKTVLNHFATRSGWKYLPAAQINSIIKS